MKALAEDMVRSLGTMIRSTTFLETYRTNSKWFSRNRMLAFASCICMILTRLVTSLRSELGAFFENSLSVEQSVTPQAFSKARRHIRAEAFEALFGLTVGKVVRANAIRRFRGYRLLAIDGSDIQLPASDELRMTYPSANASSPKSTRARASVLCDVLDGFILDARLEPAFIDERALAISHLEAYRRLAKPRDLLIMDRGYPSAKLLSCLHSLPGKFLLRISRSYETAFPRCDAQDFYTHIDYKGVKIHFRVVRIILSSGETETLITNLSERTMDSQALRELYALRWGVETAYRYLKDRLSLIRFSGKSRQTILQDYYACLTFLNIACAYAAEADDSRRDIDATRALKHRYRANRSACFAFLKQHLSRMLLFARSLSRLSARLRDTLTHAVCPVRQNRSFHRTSLRSDHRASDVQRPL